MFSSKIEERQLYVSPNDRNILPKIAFRTTFKIMLDILGYS